MDITITISDEYTDLVFEMLQKVSGKEIKLSSDLVEVDGSFSYDWLKEGEKPLDFSNRAIKSILSGIVKWGLLVKDTNRFKLDLQKKQEEIKPVSIPDISL